MQKWKLDEASEKDDYCLCAEWFYHGKSDFLHGRTAQKVKIQMPLKLVGCVSKRPICLI